MEVLEKITLTIPRARKLVKQLASVLKGLEADVESRVSRVGSKPFGGNLRFRTFKVVLPLLLEELPKIGL